jgi:hypothetical protein
MDEVLSISLTDEPGMPSGSPTGLQFKAVSVDGVQSKVLRLAGVKKGSPAEQWQNRRSGKKLKTLWSSSSLLLAVGDEIVASKMRGRSGAPSQEQVEAEILGTTRPLTVTFESEGRLQLRSCARSRRHLSHLACPRAHHTTHGW